jgi:hypothetical protein
MTENNKQETDALVMSENYFNAVQKMAFDLYTIQQEFSKKQQQATLEYWTQVLKNTYNPWNFK